MLYECRVKGTRFVAYDPSRILIEFQVLPQHREPLDRWLRSRDVTLHLGDGPVPVGRSVKDIADDLWQLVSNCNEKVSVQFADALMRLVRELKPK